MSKPTPRPVLPADADAVRILESVRKYAALPTDASRDDHARVIAGLQHLWLDIRDEWLKALARAQAQSTRDRSLDLGHRALARDVTGHGGGHRTVQERVYDGRRLLEAEQAAARQEAS